MAKMRIIADNAAERCTITTSTTAGALGAANLLTNDKAKVARSTAGTTWTITGSTATAETASCAHLPFCNLSPTATIRVRLYSDAAGTVLVLDTNTLQPGALACPAPARKPRGWTAAQAASAYANGGGAHARIWLAPTGFRKFVIDIADTNNLQGYIEAAGAVVVGTYWEAEYGPTGVQLQVTDSTTTYRNAAGGQMADAGTIHRRVPITLGYLNTADRATFMAMLMNSRAYPILVSIFPGHADLSLERDFTVYGRRPDDSDIAYQFAGAYGSKVEVEEI